MSTEIQRERIVVAGATGFIGRALCRALQADGVPLVVLTRHSDGARRRLGSGIDPVEWDARTGGAWEQALAGARAVIDLAGENIGAGRWTREKRERIRASRIDAARAIADALVRSDDSPPILIQASAIGVYGSRGEEPLTERADAGTGFLADVVCDWEAASAPVEGSGVRRVLLRSAPVLGRDGGMLPPLLRAFRWYLGGVPGDGRQWFSWIHLQDEVAAIRFLLERDELRGPVNLCAPEPVRMVDFCDAFARHLHRPAWVPLPAPFLQLAVGREKADDLLLTSARVLPEKLQRAGFSFRFPAIDAALSSFLPERNS